MPRNGLDSRPVNLHLQLWIVTKEVSFEMNSTKWNEKASFPAADSRFKKKKRFQKQCPPSTRIKWHTQLENILVDIVKHLAAEAGQISLRN